MQYSYTVVILSLNLYWNQYTTHLQIMYSACKWHNHCEHLWTHRSISYIPALRSPGQWCKASFNPGTQHNIVVTWSISNANVFSDMKFFVNCYSMQLIAEVTISSINILVIASSCIISLIMCLLLVIAIQHFTHAILC